MARIQITGWRRDASKAGADKLISEMADIGLSEAIRTIDRVMQGEVVVIAVPTEEKARNLVEALRSFNFDARIG